MTKEKLIEEIELLKQAAEGLEEPQRTFNLVDVNNLQIKLEGMALDDVAQKMSAISLPDIESMQTDIQAALDATQSNDSRVAMFNKAFTFVKTALGVVI